MAWFIAHSGKDGAYAIPGIPAESDSGTFHFSGIKEVTVALNSSETRLDLVYVSPVLGVRNMRPAGRMKSRPPTFRGRNILGQTGAPVDGAPGR